MRYSIKQTDDWTYQVLKNGVRVASGLTWSFALELFHGLEEREENDDDIRQD